MGMTKEIDQAVTEAATMSSADSRILKDGAIVGDWCVLALIGQGGNGEVYRVKHSKSGAIGALKALHSNDPHQRQRFDFESEILQKIASYSAEGTRHFPHFLDKGEISNSNIPYIVIEFLQKLELPKSSESPLNNSPIANVILGACEAIRELHKNGYLHRDIKSENLMQRENGEIVLIDFSLAVRIEDVKNPLAKRVSVTQGQMRAVGSEDSMAPEQAFGHASIRSDVYALGALANECFRGDPPPQWLPVISKAINPKPEFRYRNIEEFEAAIRQCVQRCTETEKVDLEKQIKSLNKEIRWLKIRRSIATAVKGLSVPIGIFSIIMLFTEGWSFLNVWGGLVATATPYLISVWIFEKKDNEQKDHLKKLRNEFCEKHYKENEKRYKELGIDETFYKDLIENNEEIPPFDDEDHLAALSYDRLTLKAKLDLLSEEGHHLPDPTL